MAYYAAERRWRVDSQDDLDAQMKAMPSNSPLWKDIPEEQQRQYANSPFYSQNESLWDRAKRLMGGGSKSAPTTSEQAGLSKHAMDYFTSQRWTPEQAAWIIGNLQQESSFNAGAKNDSGHAGIAQWSLERQADIAQHFGKPVSAMSYAEQLAAVQWELTEGKYKNVGKALKQTTGEGPASVVIDHGFESPGNYDAEDPQRIANSTASLSAWKAPEPVRKSVCGA
jgi:hypothetical protein